MMSPIEVVPFNRSWCISRSHQAQTLLRLSEMIYFSIFMNGKQQNAVAQPFIAGEGVLEQLHDVAGVLAESTGRKSGGSVEHAFDGVAAVLVERTTDRTQFRMDNL